MRPRSAAIIACRIIALWLGTQALLAIVSFLIVSRQFNGSGSFWGYVGTSVVIAWGLWILAETIGRAMAAGTSDDPAPQPHPLIDLHSTAFAVVGVVLITQAIPNLIRTIIESHREFAGFQFGGPYYPGFLSRGGAFAGEITRLVLGAALIYLAHPIAEALVRRSRELPPSPQPPTT